MFSSSSSSHPLALGALDLASAPVQLALAALLLSALAYHYASYTRGRVPLTGPAPWPVLGNLPQLGRHAALTLASWSRTYGPVFKIHMGEREVVVINSAAAAKELLSDKGGAFISRPTFHNFHTVLASSAGLTIGTSPWDESCKRRRKAAATAMNRLNVQRYAPVVDREVLALIEDLYTHGKGGRVALTPHDYMSRFALNTSLSVNYGCRLDEVGDALLHEIIEVEAAVSDVRSTVASWANYVPALRWAQSLRADRSAHSLAALRARRDDYMARLLSDLRARIAEGTDSPCITGSILKDPDAALSPRELSSICLSMVAAGLDTLGNTMIWGVGKLAKTPEVWEKAYAAIEAQYADTVPDSRAEDVEYITAMYRETLRWFSVLKLSLPRETATAVEYNGATIPAGTTVFLNTWAVHHDPQRYGDVDVFRPERFLHEKEEGGHALHYSFGVGRRMCAGSHLANKEMYAAFTKLVYFFKLEYDEDYDIDPVNATHNPYGLASVPNRFKLRFVPRDPDTIEHWIAEEKSKAELRLASTIH
ncbi:hypothetical protein VHUM_01636 [Vanrija humicola]|uniref:Cytochrome P450 n=1 Tax=Vanrija humicola TaxID=5417 RepID=A0A7D8V2J5_VANHU|nr:hypothetical protein VHUM_01636 [Vanrija humicola]